MGNGVLANSRNALIFAGGVVACAAVAAMSLGSQFTPDRSNEEPAALEADPPPEPRERARTEQPSEIDSQGAQSVFGEYESIADEDLIDDTQGLDTTPVDDSMVTITSDPDVEESGSSGASPAGARARQRPSLSPSRNGDTGNPLQVAPGSKSTRPPQRPQKIIPD